MQGRLGLRQASENQADAVVRGTITRYEPDLPVALSGPGREHPDGHPAAGADHRLGGDSGPARRQAALAAQRPACWRAITDPGQESEGRSKALDKLVTNIVEGAQSQW